MKPKAAIQWGAMENNLNIYTNLPHEFQWTLGNETRRLFWKNRSDKGVSVLVRNQMRSALGVWAIGVHSILNDTFRNEPYEDMDEEQKAVRCIIYMFRCAFAHNPILPKWNVTNPEYDSIFKVPSINYTFSTKGLNGKLLDDAKINWLGLIDLMQYCETLVD